jgi:hypothetical protein
MTLMSLMALLNIVLRLPWTSHAVGVDTFFVQGLAASISKFGSAKWLIHPTSVFGFYPYSYPSAQPFILSGLSQSSGISIEYVTLIFSIFLSLLGLCSAFILAKEIFDDDLYAILISFFYSISPNFIELTYWQASSRSLFMAIFPLMIWFFVKIKDRVKIEHILLIFTIEVFLFTAHRAAAFSLFIIIGYIITLIINYLLKKSIIDLSSPVMKVHAQYILLILSSILFFSQFTPLGIFNLDHYQSGILHSGSDSFSTLLNMMVDYVGKIGIIVPFVIIGFFNIINKAEKRFGELFILFYFIIFLPLMGSDVYSPLALSIFLVIFSSAGVISAIRYITGKRLAFNFHKNLNFKSFDYTRYINDLLSKFHLNTGDLLNFKIYRNFLFALIFTCLVFSTIFSLFMIKHWNLESNSINDQTSSSIYFIKDYSNRTVIANTGALASKITAYTSNPVLPLGGAYASPAPPGQIIYGFVNKNEFSVKSGDLSHISPNTDVLYGLESSRDANSEWVYIMENNYRSDESKSMRSMYNYPNLVIATGNPVAYLYWSWRGSLLLTSLSESGDIIYTNDMETIYSIPEKSIS